MCRLCKHYRREGLTKDEIRTCLLEIERRLKTCPFKEVVHLDELLDYLTDTQMKDRDLQVEAAWENNRRNNGG